MRAGPGGMDLVFIEGFVEHTLIGIDPPELAQQQPVRFDLTIGVRYAKACATDNVKDTIHYGEVLARLRRLLREQRFQMLERLAEEAAKLILAEFRAEWIRVRVSKPRKFADVDAVGVQIERHRVQPTTPWGNG